MDSDEEDFEFYGSPIDREEEIGSRKKKTVAEASDHLGSLPSWKQEVIDEEGQRRFHGTFTTSFSAGYYNTVGSKEGWTPQSFTSSRNNRTEVKQQSILNFLDEDEKAELEDRCLSKSSQFDSFGFTDAEIARKQAEKEQQQRPSTILGPARDKIVLPAAEFIASKMEEPAISKKELLPLLQSDSGDISKNEAENEMDVEVEVGNVERPVDLYKAIFSDDSDEEQEDSNLRRAEYQEKKFEADNTALNPLIAGDFLESLGKEPGLEVPPEFPCPVQKTRNPAPQKENVDARNASINNSSSPHAFGVTTGLGIPKLQEEFSRNGKSHKSESNQGNEIGSGANKNLGNTLSDNKFVNFNKGRTEEDSKVRTPLIHQQKYSSSSSSEDERSRKRSRRHQRGSSDRK